MNRRRPRGTRRVRKRVLATFVAGRRSPREIAGLVGLSEPAVRVILGDAGLQDVEKTKNNDERKRA